MRIIATVAMVAACSHAAAPGTPTPPAELPIPGLLWLSPAQPFRLDESPRDLVLDGPRLLMALDVRVVQLDLATGQRGRAVKLDFSPNQLVHLDGERVLAVGTRDQHFVAVVVDGATLAVTAVPVVGAVTAFEDLSYAARLGDGRVVMHGRGLPIAIYDPQTWHRDVVLDDTRSWTDVVAGGNHVYASAGSAKAHYDLALGGWSELGTLYSGVAATADGFIGRAMSDVDHKIHLTLLHDHHVVRRFDDAATFATDDRGLQLATLSAGVLRVHTIATGKERSRFDLGASADVLHARVVLDAHHVVVLAESSLRVIDLATGEVTPIGAPPYGSAGQVAVRPDGAILVTGTAIWRLVDGRVTASAPLAEPFPMTSSAGELRHFGTFEDIPGGTTTFVIRSVDDPKPVQRWVSPQSSNEAWLGESGEVVAIGRYDGRYPTRILRTSGATVVPVIAMSTADRVPDVDVDGGYAAVQAHGAVRVARLRDAQVLPGDPRVPSCDDSTGGVALERHGDRLATYSGSEVAVWNRNTGALVASLDVGEDDSVGRVGFVSGTDELLLEGVHWVELWSPSRRERRSIDVNTTRFTTQVSSDGTRLAIAFGSGRVALVDVLAMRAGTRPTPATTAASHLAPCPGDDPFEVPPDEQPGTVDPPDGEQQWVPDPE